MAAKAAAGLQGTGRRLLGYLHIWLQYSAKIQQPLCHSAGI